MKPIVYTILGLFAAVTVACKSNPYEGKPAVAPPQKPQASPSPTPVPTATPTPAPTPVPTPKPIFSLDAPDVMNFVVGQSGEYIIRGTVPAPGVAQITFKDAPTGYAYTPADGRFSWKPSAEKTFTIQVRLKSSIDPVSVHTKDIVVVVSKTALSSTAITTRVVENSTDSLAFELRATDLELGQFAEWQVQGENAVYSVSKVHAKLPQSLLSVRWAPESSDSVLKLRACTVTSCASREIKIVADKLQLKDPTNGAVMILGGDQ